MNQLFQTLKKHNTKTPIWIMRQAGRYLPEYTKIRKTSWDFLDLCYDVEKAVVITMQPINRYHLDAAIMFSDILVLPDALGWDVQFKENIGPVLYQFKSKDDFKFFVDPNKKLEIIYKIIQKLKKELQQDIPLIGFAGSPWTVISYMLEGRGKHDFKISKKFIYENKSLAKDLIEFITNATIDYLRGQIDAGVDIIKLFDSWAGVLSGEEYDEFVVGPTKKMVSSLKKYSAVPIIGFPRNSGFLYEKYIENTGIDIIACDQSVPLNIMKLWSKKIIVQGNLDPVILLTNKKVIEKKAEEILSNFPERNFIFNLGHGVMPETPVENVQFLVDYVKGFRF